MAWAYEGQEILNVAVNAVAGRPKEEYGFEPTCIEELRTGTYDIHDRVMDMNANGVLGSMCFPSFPNLCGQLFARSSDLDAALAIVKAYNDWHVDEWCGTYPGRFIPLMIPPLWDPQEMAAEVRRLAAKGCHAVTFSENPEKLKLPSLHSDHWDPFWQACSDEGTTVCMHIGSSSKLVITAQDAPVDVMIVLQPMNIVQCAGDLIHSPVFKKFPDLTVALSEGGIGWIPYFLERLDHSYRVHKAWTGADFGSKMPSEVFLEHVVLCFISDPVGLELARDHIGIDRITVEIDYPHSDTTWPRSPERLQAEFERAKLTDAEVNAITYENAMRFFHYDPFTHVPKDQATVGALRAAAVGVDTAPVARGRRFAPRENIKITDVNATA